MESQESMRELKDASEKLNYILSMKNQNRPRHHNQQDTHRKVVIDKYLKDIKESISEVAGIVTEAYESIKTAEEGNEDAYKTLYESILDNVNKDKQFLNDMGPSIMWYSLFQHM